VRRARADGTAPGRDRALLPCDHATLLQRSRLEAASSVGAPIVSDLALQLIWADTSDALKAGVSDSRDDRHLSHTPLVLDQKGWDELNELVARLHERAAELTAESAARLGRSGGQCIRSRLVLMHVGAAPEGSPAKGPGPGAATGEERFFLG
jgi:hypothetical protein